MTDRVDRSNTQRWSMESIYQEVLRRICTREYPFRTRLGEVELASEFEVSRTPVRAVLQRLQTEGLIDIRHGVGSIVIAGDPDTLDDIYDLRLEIAELIATLSPRPIERGMIDEVETLLGIVRDAATDAPSQLYLDINARLHRVVNGLIGNAELARLHDHYYYRIAPFWYGLALDDQFGNMAGDIAGDMDDLEAELGETLRALQAGDVRAVAKVHRNYTAYGRIRVRDRLARSATALPAHSAS